MHMSIQIRVHLIYFSTVCHFDNACIHKYSFELSMSLLQSRPLVYVGKAISKLDGFVRYKFRIRKLVGLISEGCTLEIYLEPV